MNLYMAFHCIEKEDGDFCPDDGKLIDENFKPVFDEQRILVCIANDIDREVRKQIELWASYFRVTRILPLRHCRGDALRSRTD